MKKQIELLAPGGDIDSIKAAILAGADAVYCGLDKFNARNRAANIGFDELKGVIRLAHRHHCQIFLTLNILILESEIPALIQLLNKLVNTPIDGVIVQDLGLLYILKEYFPSLPVHASTQMTTHNKGQIDFLKKLNVERVNLCRELNLNEIKDLTSFAKSQDMDTEVFVHGSQCICFSGICYMSSLHGGNSGNRGKCSQPCRDMFTATPTNKSYPLNLKDNMAFRHIEDLYKAGVYSLKIEGRIKKHDYIHTVVSAYKKQIQNILTKSYFLQDDSNLRKVFNRDFSDGYITGRISNEMFIDNPRDNTLKHFNEVNSQLTNIEKEKAEKALLDEKEDIKKDVELGIKGLSIERTPVNILISGEKGRLLKIRVETPVKSFEVCSDALLKDAGNEALSYEALYKRLKVINETDFYIEKIDLGGIKGKVHIAFKELTSLKTKILYFLNGSKERVAPVKLPPLKKTSGKSNHTLSIVISSLDDILLCSETNTAIYFKLPSNFSNQLEELVKEFKQNPKLIPWFPPILIGEEYDMALQFLTEINPAIIVTENTGIAYESFIKGITWMAGPNLNITNSYTLKSLKENFNCAGAFISNELNKETIKRIQKPENFKLCFSIYHPINLMTTRQCLFQNIMGCNKRIMDEDCILSCERSTTITHSKGAGFIVEKSKGNYHRIFNDINYLNLDIAEDMPDGFESFIIDLSNVETETKLHASKTETIRLFKNLTNKNTEAKNKLNQEISPSTNHQYHSKIFR